ncbi:hypothetical protein Pfo_026937 [Paulownia fortunei]|nr:hypothetical protein Pfo_026937 [Paulownia fortunei]
MEGLIPMVYKSLKKNKTRRKYECLSSGAASHTYNIADFYIKDDHHDYFSKKQEYVIPGPDKVSGLRGAHHRRYNSVHVIGRGRGFALEEEAAAAKPKQLVRFRSHRMLSCITGA